MSVYGYTSYFRFRKINYNSNSWHEDEYINLDNLDGILSALTDDVPFVVATGSANAFVLTYSPVITAYTAGLIVSFVTNFAPTGTTTINVNGLGAKTIKLSGNDVTTGDLNNGQYIRAIYDGTNFQVVVPLSSFNSGVLSNGPSGATAATSADDLVVENNTDAGMSFLSPIGATQRIYFARPTSNTAGGIIYNHATDVFTIRAGIADVMTISGAGVVTANSFVGAISGTVTGNAATATKLQATRTIGITGDLTYTSPAFDGSANVTAAGTIANDAITTAKILNLNVTEAKLAADAVTTAKILNAAVTNAKLAHVPTATIKGRTTAGTGDVENLTADQATAILSVMVGDSGAGGTKGLVPTPGTGDARKTLRGGGSFKGLSVRAAACITAPAGVFTEQFSEGCSIVRGGTGVYTLSLDTPASTQYGWCCVVTCSYGTGATTEQIVAMEVYGSRSTTSIVYNCEDNSSVLRDPDIMNFIVYVND